MVNQQHIPNYLDIECSAMASNYSSHNITNTYSKIKLDTLLHTLGGFDDMPDQILHDRYLTPKDIKIIQKEIIAHRNKGRVPHYFWPNLAKKIGRLNPNSLKVLYHRYYKMRWNI